VVKIIESVVDDLISQIRVTEFDLPPLATGEWNWINNKYRNEYVYALYNHDWDALRTFLLNPLSPLTAYGLITPINTSTKLNESNNDFFKDLQLFRSNHSTDQFKALEHQYMLKHNWSKYTEAFYAYPDSPRHADFALKILKSLKVKSNPRNGLEIGGGYGGLIYYLRKFGFEGKLLNCDLLETLLVSFVFLRCNGLRVRLCLTKQNLQEALNDQDEELVILITTDLFKYFGEHEQINFVFNSRSFSEMSRSTSTEYLERINLKIKPNIVFSENAEEILFPNSERHIEITQNELTSVLSNYKVSENTRTDYVGGANRYTLRILQRLNLSI